MRGDEGRAGVRDRGGGGQERSREGKERREIEDRIGEERGEDRMYRFLTISLMFLNGRH